MVTFRIIIEGQIRKRKHSRSHPYSAMHKRLALCVSAMQRTPLMHSSVGE